LASGLPILNVRNSEDHAQIDAIAGCLQRPWRSRFARRAYRRLVWHLAQLAMMDKRVCRAVSDLGRALNDNHWPTEPQVPGTMTGTMHGAKARTIMRRAGVVSGMLKRDVRQISEESRAQRCAKVIDRILAASAGDSV
jgi:hypothetical protein